MLADCCPRRAVGSPLCGADSAAVRLLSWNQRISLLAGGIHPPHAMTTVRNYESLLSAEPGSCLTGRLPQHSSLPLSVG